MDTNEKPKTIATIDVNLTVPKVSKEEWIDESIHEHLNCILCGTELSLSHHTDFVNQTVSEEAHCKGCKVRNRQSSYRLQ